MPDHRRALAHLKDAFPNAKITEGTFRVYLDHLDDLPQEGVEKAAYRIVDTQDWFPTIRQIREAVIEETLALPSEVEALAQVEAGGRLHIVVGNALAMIGGKYAWRTAEEPTVLRGQFLKLYRQERERVIQEAMIGRFALNPAPAADDGILLPHGR